MEILKILGVGIITTIAYIVIKHIKPEFSSLILIAGSCLILCLIVGYIADIMHVIDKILTQTGINKDVFNIILKIIGIGYLVEFGANFCNDAGNSSIADKILVAGKLIILFVSMPIITSLFNTVLGLLQ